jgi:hypothetical protein
MSRSTITPPQAGISHDQTIRQCRLAAVGHMGYTVKVLDIYVPCERRWYEGGCFIRGLRVLYQEDGVADGCRTL